MDNPDKQIQDALNPKDRAMLGNPDECMPAIFKARNKSNTSTLPERKMGQQPLAVAHRV